MFERTLDVERGWEWVRSSLQREICVPGLLTPSPGQFVQDLAGLRPQRPGHPVASRCKLLVSWRGRHRVGSTYLKASLVGLLSG